MMYCLEGGTYIYIGVAPENPRGGGSVRGYRLDHLGGGGLTTRGGVFNGSGQVSRRR
jgi:hypothetical protein